MDVVDIATLVEAQCERDYFMNEVKEARERFRELEKRIRKAREILEESVKRECGTFETRYYYDEIKAALEALEGK